MLTEQLTIDGFIDRILRDWLHPADAQPIRFTGEEVDATTTTISIDTTTLPPEVGQILSPGVVVEWDLELMQVRSINNNSLEVRRGVNGTEPAAHPSTRQLTLSPPYTRQALVSNIIEALRYLYPPLYHLHSVTLTVPSDGAWVEIPAYYLSPQSLVVTSGSNVIQGVSMSELLNFPPSPTTKAVQFYGAPPGSQVHLTFRSAAHRVESITDKMYEDLGVEPEWYRLVEVDVVSRMIMGRDLEGHVVQSLMARMDAEGFPPLTAARLHQTLDRYYEVLKNRAAQTLRARDGIAQFHHGRFIG